eukprot:comp6420_c0_seq1/m.2222 comp6420_c0_seq1/g.2222  ORF comp6420_c0_seq1/g.2222 comp6420_c0_seq1/m.2222 type:complete len:180 (-) comp6420_c0_seq1:404-943(-)
MPKIAREEKRVKTTHPESREARRQNRAVVRHERITKRKTEHQQVANTLCLKLQWFFENLDVDKDFYTDADMIEFIQRYIARHDLELEHIALLNRHGTRHKASREDALLACKKEETAQLVSGFQGPDLTTEKLLTQFKMWDGSVPKMQALPLKTYKLPKQPQQPPAPKTPAPTPSNAMTE